MTWTPDLVAERFAAAATTLARSRAGGIGPAGFRVAWPDIPQTLEQARTAYGYTAATPPRIQPSAADLTALDQVLVWSSRYLSAAACHDAGMPHDAGHVVWMRASGHSFQRIASTRQRRWATKPAGGNSGEAVRQICARAHEHVAKALRRDRVPIAEGAGEPVYEPPAVLDGRREAMPRAMDTRRYVTSARPCGECRHMSREVTARCLVRGGAVSPAMRAQHPENEPCFEAKKN
jgi:hypothetical protein